MTENFGQNHRRKIEKGHFRLTCVAQKRLCLSSLMIQPGGVLPYIRHWKIGMYRAPKGRVFVPFGMKTGIDFAHFNLELGMVYTASVYQFQIN